MNLSNTWKGKVEVACFLPCKFIDRQCAVSQSAARPAFLLYLMRFKYRLFNYLIPKIAELIFNSPRESLIFFYQTYLAYYLNFD